MRRTHACSYLLAALAIAVTDRAALATPASPHPVIAEQPDGTKIALRIRGDENVNWHEDLNGYPVERRANGLYVYAAPAAAAAAAAAAGQDLVVGKVDPAAAGVKKGMPPRPGV